MSRMAARGVRRIRLRMATLFWESRGNLRGPFLILRLEIGFRSILPIKMKTIRIWIGAWLYQQWKGWCLSRRVGRIQALKMEWQGMILSKVVAPQGLRGALILRLQGAFAKSKHGVKSPRIATCSLRPPNATTSGKQISTGCCLKMYAKQLILPSWSVKTRISTINWSS